MAGPTRESRSTETGGTTIHSTGGSPATGTPERRILLVDCDMFFVQVARLEDPDGVGRIDLLLVGGRSRERGVVTSASYPARRFGVRSGMPTARALELCPECEVVAVPREACGRTSRAILGILREIGPVVEPASIDEFYLDLSGTDRLFHGASLEAIGHRIRKAVLDGTRISVSVGGGSSKLVAKLAVRLAKPGGVHVVAPGDESDFLRGFDLAAIPGVGPKMAEELRRRGLATVEDALAVEEEWLTRWFGDQRGSWLHRRIRGIDDSPVVNRPRRKSISSERTFPTDLHDDEVLDRALLRLAYSVAHELRERELAARTMTVKLRDPDFRTRTASRTLPEPIESDAGIVTCARQLLAELRRSRRRGVRLLGVAASNLVRADERQLGLFGDLDPAAPVQGIVERERDRAISRTVDELRRRFGSDAVVPGRLVPHPKEAHDDDDEE